MADFPKLLATFIIITLFAFLLVGFATRLGDNYGKDAEIEELEDKIGSAGISDTIEGIEEDSEKWKDKFFEDDESEEKGGFLQTFKDVLDVIGVLAVGIFNLAKNMGAFVFAPFVMFNHILTGVLEVPVVVATILEVLLLLGIIFGIWRLIKTGQ